MKHEKLRVGWIGLGSVGTQMVKRMIEGGEDVTVFPRGAGTKDALKTGARECSDYTVLASKSDVLGLCVYEDWQVSDVLFNQGALAALPLGSTLIIHTTGSPGLRIDIARRAPVGVEVLDACFSGGSADAAAAKLILMVGGRQAPLDRVTPLLRHYAARIFLVGGIGTGQKLKLINNLLFATNLMNAVEAVSLAEKHGFAPELAAEVMGTCSAASYALKLLAHPEQYLSIMQAIRPYLEKDVALAIDNADDSDIDVSVFAATAAYFGHNLAV